MKLYIEKKKKKKNVDNKEEVEEIFCDITCKYLLKICSKK